MKPGDPGYRTRMKRFKGMHCKHQLDGANPLLDGCTLRVGATDTDEDLAECPHQPGWYCNNPKNPGNIRLEDLVLEAL